MLGYEYGEFKLDESLAKLEPFKKRIKKRKEISPTTTIVKKRKNKKKRGIWSSIAEIGKGALSVALMKYLGISPKTPGEQVAEPTLIGQQRAEVVTGIPTIPKRADNMKFILLGGGVILIITAILLTRRR